MTGASLTKRPRNNPLQAGDQRATATADRNVTLALLAAERQSRLAGLP